MVATWADAELAEAVRSAMTKIEAVVPEGLRRVVLETALFAPDFPRTATMANEVATLRRAIAEHRILALQYTRADGQTSEREVRPLGLYFWGNRWTLAAWCDMRRDYRSFRPDRMSEVRVLDIRFDPGDGINLAQFLARVEEPAPAVNADGVGCRYDAGGVCAEVALCGSAGDASDDCLGEHEPRAWSSPIFVDQPR